MLKKEIYEQDLVIVDVSALMRTYYRPLNSKYPMSVNLDIGVLNTSHLYGLFRLILKYGKDTHYIFAYDGPKNILKELNPEYKAGREKVSNDYYTGLNLGEEILRQAGFEVLKESGYEADHIIIQVKELLSKYYPKTYVITNDKDLAVVVDDKTEWIPTRSKANKITMDDYEVQLECPYNGIHLKKALVGDPSDNLKGVYRFGPAKFQKFVKHDDLANRPIYKHEKEIIENTDFLDDYEKSQALSDLKIIQPLHVPNINPYFNEIDWDYFKEMLELLEMKSLYKKL